MRNNKFKLGHVWDCTEVFKQKVDNGEILGVGKGDDMIYRYGYFIAYDVYDFHIYRVQVGINREYEDEPRTKIVEQWDVSKGDILEELNIYNYEDVRTAFDDLKGISIKEIVDAIIELDCYDNDDVAEYRYDTPLEEIYADIDGGYGITKINFNK